MKKKLLAWLAFLVPVLSALAYALWRWKNSTKVFQAALEHTASELATKDYQEVLLNYQKRLSAVEQDLLSAKHEEIKQRFEEAFGGKK